MRKLAWFALATLVAASATAQSVYQPNRKIAEQNIVLKGWGSGTISETDEQKFEGVYSLCLTTRNFFQGGMINLGSPIDLSTAFGDKNSLLRFAIRSSGEKPRFATSTGSGANGGGPGIAGAGQGGGGGQSGFDGGGGGGAQGGRGGSTTGATLTTEAVLRTIRLVVTTSDGLKSEAYMSVQAVGAEAWRNFSLPLNAIHGFDRTNKNIQSIAMSGDALSTFWVGDIRVINDATPINGEMNFKSERNLSLGQELEFIGYGFAGSTPLKYEWDFDGDGLADAEGSAVKHKFRKDGTFNVTLTIRDLYGNKKPYSTSITVKVNP